MQTARYFRLALLGATLLSTPVLAATNDQATNPPPANNTSTAATPAPAGNMATTMTPGAMNAPAKNANNNTAATTPPANNNNVAANNAQGPNAKGPDGTLHKYDNEWRASKLVGANVYNDQGQTVASINDLLVTDDGKIDRAVLSTGGGILGVGSRLVTVPFSQLKFQPSVNNNNNNTNNVVAVNNNNNNTLPRTEAPAGNGNPNGTAATTANGQTAPTSGAMVANNNTNGNNATNNNNPENFSVVLPGATADSLKNEQEFKYAAD